MNYWLDSAGPAIARDPLPAAMTADVVFIGGGFSALWAAWYLLGRQPGLDVVILEREHCGFGASGRNGGWCSPRFPVDADALIRRHGAQVARECVLAAVEGVQEVGRVVAQEGIDAEFREHGILVLARRAAHVASLRATQATFESLGLAAHNTLLDRAGASERIHATEVHGALACPHGALVHPLKLARGLARAVERRGGRIFERTAVTGIARGAHPQAITAAGAVQARRALVVAGEAYSTALPGMRRDLLPVSSMIVATEPLSAGTWRDIGWAGGEGVSSCSPLKPYLTKTTDGRLLFGSRGAPYAFGSALRESALEDDALYQPLRDKACEWFPVLRDVRFTHAWGGFLGVPRDWMPGVWFDGPSRLARLGGYTGRGVTTSNLAGRLLAAMVTGERSGLESLPIARPGMPRWEREPLRFAAVRYVQGALARMEHADAMDRPRPWDAPLAEWLGHQ